MESLSDLKKFSDTLGTQEKVMPLLFVGHGSPMNAIEENEFSNGWKRTGSELPKPHAILCISAHWETRGTFVTAMEHPKTIHDFYGFPQELSEVEYPAPGDPRLAKQTKDAVKHTDVEFDNQWGLDHGCWSVLKHLYPAADIPVIQLSMDYTKPSQWHYDLAKELAVLRKKGVLIIGSGNMVHNLRLIDWRHPSGAFDWAEEMNVKFKKFILDGDSKQLINYPSLGKPAALAIPTPEHFLPLLYVLGLKEQQESTTIFNDKLVMGSISMTSLKIGN